MPPYWGDLFCYFLIINSLSPCVECLYITGCEVLYWLQVPARGQQNLLCGAGNDVGGRNLLTPPHADPFLTCVTPLPHWLPLNWWPLLIGRSLLCMCCTCTTRVGPSEWRSLLPSLSPLWQAVGYGWHCHWADFILDLNHCLIAQNTTTVHSPWPVHEALVWLSCWLYKLSPPLFLLQDSVFSHPPLDRLWLLSVAENIPLLFSLQSSGVGLS